MLHYHIRWSSKQLLDWEAHPSRADAEARANNLVRPGETYTIEEHNESCPRCWNLKLKREDANSNRSYSWQQTVLEALGEANPQRRITKVNAAQRAIYARLANLNPIDLDEQAAVGDALRRLGTLMQKGKQKPDSEGIA